ncbi:hypothetical protein BRAS3809_4600004 [Bradyrhizobium sp. STM 3809]|nr:hypothetical protein BRAS3809_4600004 [Bradyrhizobium sp. STM 3809]
MGQPGASGPNAAFTIKTPCLCATTGNIALAGVQCPLMNGYHGEACLKKFGCSRSGKTREHPKWCG